MNPVTAWLVSLLTFLAPPERAARVPPYPGWAEAPEARSARYEAIAADLYAVVYDPATAPLYQGPRGRASTAALIVAVAFKESGFAPDADLGPCYRGAPGGKLWRRCDGGRSACMMQVLIDKGTTSEGWSQNDLFADRKKCFSAGLRLLRRSYVACTKAGNAREHLLNAYASGVCGLGHSSSLARVGLARTLLTRGNIPLDGPHLTSGVDDRLSLFLR